MKRTSTILASVAALSLAALVIAAPADAREAGMSKVVHNTDGNAMRITLMKVKYLTGSGYFKPKAGTKWFGAYMRVQNLSKHLIDDCAGNDAKFTGSNQAQYDEAFMADVKPSLDCFKLLPGRTLQGWVVWEMPKRVKPKFIDWTMDSGYADQTVTWNL